MTMLNRHQQYGEAGEALATRLLRQKGYKILATNYRTRLGEIDIIARHRDTIVFVEVKARHTLQFRNPKWAVTPQKQRKISMVALYYLKTTGQSQSKARFDVVAIQSTATPPEVEIIQNAFELRYG
jgi:putative endonuclease